MMRAKDCRLHGFAAALFIALSLLWGAVPDARAQSLGFAEDCIAFDHQRAEVRRYSSSWKLVVGTLWLADFGDSEQEARRALEVIRHYGLDRQCFVGRPNPSLEYYLADGRAPAGPLPGEDCTAFNPLGLEIRRDGGHWKIADGDRWLLDFGGSRAEAEKALKIIRHYGFTHLCYVGRPQPSLTYLRSGVPASAAAGGQPPATDSAAGGARETAAAPASGPETVNVYGQASCGRCKAMMSSLRESGIPAVFHDINQDSERRAEMWRHIRREHPGVNNVSIPVVIVGKTVLINPDVGTVREEARLAASRPAAPPRAAVASSWDESLYARFDHQSFFGFEPASRRIELEAIDLPLLQAALFFETNRVRVAAGRSPLAYHPGCAAAAQMHARDMVEGKFFAHENPHDPAKTELQDRAERFGIRWRWLAENINQGMGDGTYVEVARRYVDSWMNSSGHRANMLSPNPTHMGTGAYNAGHKWSDLYFYSVQVFAWVNE